MIDSMRKWMLLIFFALLTACATPQLDKADAKNLAAAGQVATQSLRQQTVQVKTALVMVPTIIVVKEILACNGVKRADLRDSCIGNSAQARSGFEDSRKTLVDILDRRQKALKALEDAYADFADFATDEAGQNTAKAIDSAFGKINALTASMAPILPAGVVIAPITSTLAKVVGELGTYAADKRQAELLLATSRDLRTAVEAMIQVLQAEEDSAAMKSLMVELQDEVGRLERVTLDSGLASPMSVLGPYYASVAPDIALAASPPAASADLAAAAARHVLAQTMSSRELAMTAAYDQAIRALLAVRAEHLRLEAKQGIDVAQILAEVQRLQDIEKSIGK